ncbi:MAG: winged helix-turn-helix transcriptional regulator [Deltaproteobacteria bacterium]|nr:winged helix-turn-helix transcriptional regulator [Deltaproteobacteria bacterium]
MSGSISWDPSFEAWWLIHQTTHLMNRARRKELKRYGTVIVQCGILFAVEILGDRATPAELARWLAREHHTILQVLKGMEKKGLIKRTKDLERKNLVRISLTKKGKTLYRKTKRESVEYIMSCLNDREQKTLCKYMERLRERSLMYLGEYEKPAAPPSFL